MKPVDDSSIGFDPPPAVGPDLKDVERACSTIQKHNSVWKKPRKSLGLTPKDWVPSLVSNSGAACHVHLIEHLGQHWVDRMRLAKIAKHPIAIAAPLSGWQFDETLIAANELDAEPILLSDNRGEWEVETYSSVANLIARQKLLLKPESLQILGTRLIDGARKAKGAHVRGKRFEHFLAFLFSQIPDFEVFEQNYRTETEEIDIVLKNRRTNGLAWPPNSPLVLVSGKNKSESVGAPSVTSLESKLDKRRGMCRLGFLCASGAISQDAYTHELRYSQSEKVLVLLDGKGLDKLLQKPHKLTQELEKAVIEASLR